MRSFHWFIQNSIAFEKSLWKKHKINWKVALNLDFEIIKDFPLKNNHELNSRVLIWDSILEFLNNTFLFSNYKYKILFKNEPL